MDKKKTAENKVLANSYLLKAQDDLLHSSLMEQEHFMSKLEIETQIIKGESQIDRQWREKVVQFKGTNEVLKNKLLQLTPDLSNITDAGYNFKDRKITKPDWMLYKANPNETHKKILLQKKKLPSKKLLIFLMLLEQTFNPLGTPETEINEQFVIMRDKLKIAIKKKSIGELESLCHQATVEFPMELETLICHGEFLIKKHNEQQSESQAQIQYEYEYDSEEETEQASVFSNNISFKYSNNFLKEF